MARPDYDGGRKWADAYCTQIKPNIDEVMGRKGALSYPVELFMGPMQAVHDGRGYEVPEWFATGMLDRSPHDPYAFDVIRRIIAENRYNGGEVPDSWLDFEKENTLGQLKRPTKTREIKGKRDMIFAVMANHLEHEFKIPLDRGVSKNPKKEQAPCGTEIIADAMRGIGERPPTPEAIAKAVYRYRNYTFE